MRRRGPVGRRRSKNRLYWDSLTFDVVKQWRAVHFPITLAFAVLAAAHILAVLPVLGLDVKRRWAMRADCGQSARAGGARLHLPHLHGQSGTARVRSCRISRPIASPATYLCTELRRNDASPATRSRTLGCARPKGAPVATRPAAKVAFHQQLASRIAWRATATMKGPALRLAAEHHFSHAAFAPRSARNCETCHTPPDNNYPSRDQRRLWTVPQPATLEARQVRPCQAFPAGRRSQCGLRNVPC